MNFLKQYKADLSIKQSILLLILLPSFLITTLLTTYLIISRQSDAQNELLLQANSIINYLTSSSELALFGGDIPTLQRLGNAAVSNNEINSVTFYDSNRELISSSGEKTDRIEIHSINTFYNEEKSSLWIFQTPIYNTEIEVDDYKDENKSLTDNTNNQEKYLGWVQVIADKSALRAKQRRILFGGFATGSMLFGLLAFLASRLSRSLTLPLYKLTETVQALKAGDLDYRVSVETNGELKHLVDGVNQLADKVKISNKRLNFKINEATQQLTSTLTELEIKNKELELTGSELVNANNAKDEFLANVSHELRTPLTSIIGYADLLQKARLENEQITQVETISQASKILLQLIDNILDFSKLEAESLELENIPFNINTLLSEVASLHMPAAQAKGLKLQVTTDINLIEDIVGDPLRIKQIFNNLIQNAIKFTDSGSVTISVSPLEDQFGLWVNISDTGIGIKEENQSKLFKPFNQLDTSITRRFGGTGLGLVICKKLIAQLGGNIQIKSEIDKGTEISFSIVNIHPQDTSITPEFSNLQEQTQHDYKILTGKLILIAEDNDFVKKLLIDIFESEGAKTITTVDGSQTLKALESQKPDLVILDFQMPILDGIDTCKEIRRKYSKQQLPVILLTADVINTNKKEIESDGVNKVIFKPIQVDALIESVEQLIFNRNTIIRKQSNTNKVLDLVSDDVLQAELRRLQSNIVSHYKAKEYKSLNKPIHDLCGIAGSSSQYKTLWEIAKKLDLSLKDQKYDEMEAEIRVLQHISFPSI